MVVTKYLLKVDNNKQGGMCELDQMDGVATHVGNERHDARCLERLWKILVLVWTYKAQLQLTNGILSIIFLLNGAIQGVEIGMRFVYE